MVTARSSPAPGPVEGGDARPAVWPSYGVVCVGDSRLPVSQGEPQPWVLRGAGSFWSLPPRIRSPTLFQRRLWEGALPGDLWSHSHCRESLPTCPQPSLMRRATHGLRDPSFPHFHGHRWPRPPIPQETGLRHSDHPLGGMGSPITTPTQPWSTGSRFSPASFFSECRALGSWKKGPGERAKLRHQGVSLRPDEGWGGEGTGSG